MIQKFVSILIYFLSIFPWKGQMSRFLIIILIFFILFNVHWRIQCARGYGMESWHKYHCMRVCVCNETCINRQSTMTISCCWLLFTYNYIQTYNASKRERRFRLVKEIKNEILSNISTLASLDFFFSFWYFSLFSCQVIIQNEF